MLMGKKTMCGVKVNKKSIAISYDRKLRRSARKYICVML
jgi:hypothetical protein